MCEQPIEATQYPQFVPNQVLTANLLNDLRDYLDVSNRQGILKTTGRGIVCGLEWKAEYDVPATKLWTITISDGYGISSEGYLLPFKGGEFTHAQTYNDPSVMDENGVIKPKYKTWRQADGLQISLLELLPSSALIDGKLNTHELTNADVKNKVIVLYLEIKERPLNSCIATDCNNKGVETLLTVRPLLVPKSAMVPVSLCPTEKYPTPRIKLRVPRLHSIIAGGITSVSDSAILMKGFGTIVKYMTPILDTEIEKAYNKYHTGSYLVGYHVETPPKIAERINPWNQNNKTSTDLVQQYLYDFIRDLTDAYNEFMAHACGLVIDCCTEGAFPRHLMLGSFFSVKPNDLVDPDIYNQSYYRNNFEPSPVKNVLFDDLELSRRLFCRLVELIKNFNYKGIFSSDRIIHIDPSISITPSQTEMYPLGQRAVPYYYGLPTAIKRCWQLSDDCCVAEPLHSYHKELILEETITPKTWLDHNFDLDYVQETFFRIEGQIRHEGNAAMQKIQDKRQEHNLEFDLLKLPLNPFPNQNKANTEFTETMEDKFDNIQKHIETAAFERWLTVFKTKITTADFTKDYTNNVAIPLDTLIKKLDDTYTAWQKTTCNESFTCPVAHLEEDYLLLRAEWKAQNRSQFIVFQELLEIYTIVTKNPDTSLASKKIIYGLFIESFYAHLYIPLVAELFLPKNLHCFHYLYFARLIKLVAFHIAQIRAYIETSLSLSASEGRLLANFIAKLAPLSNKAYFIDHYGRFLGQFSILYDSLEAMRQQHTGSFAQFAAKNPGMEHRSGVAKGGTFILVTEFDKSGVKETVVTDFALDGQVHCGCDCSLDDVCFAPVALPNIAITKASDAVGAIIVNLSEDDLTFNFPNCPCKDVASQSLNFKLISDDSRFSGSLELTNNKVKYIPKIRNHIFVDSFEYEIDDATCKSNRTDRARVYIVVKDYQIHKKG